MLKLQGIFAPVSTPFNHRGEIYTAKAKSNIERLNAVNLSGYVIGDSLLTAEERPLMWELAARSAAPGKQLGAVATAPSVREAVALANQAAGLGYHFAVVQAEVPATRDLYYRSVADGSKLPIVISGDLSNDHPNIAATVDGQVRKPGLPVLTAKTTALFPSLRAGCVGAILPIVNAIPYSVQLIWEAYRQREEEAGLDWQERITPLAHLLAEHGLPGLKLAMDLNSYYGGVPRLPWVPLAESLRPAFVAALHDLKS